MKPTKKEITILHDRLKVFIESKRKDIFFSPATYMGWQAHSSFLMGFAKLNKTFCKLLNEITEKELEKFLTVKWWRSFESEISNWLKDNEITAKTKFDKLIFSLYDRDNKISVQINLKPTIDKVNNYNRTKEVSKTPVDPWDYKCVIPGYIPEDKETQVK